TTLRLTLRSQRKTSGRVRVYHDGKPVVLEAESAGGGYPVHLEPGLNTFQLRLPLRRSGAHRFEARYEPDNPNDDTIVSNNVATAFTTVEGPATVLLVSDHPEDDQPLSAALEKEQIHVDLKRPSETELDPVSLQQYAAVLLSNVPADEFRDSEHRALAT